MWDVTSMGVRGLAPWSWSNFEITGCQISNWKHFRLKMWDFTTKGVRGLAPEAEAFLKIISCWDFTSIGVIGFAPWSWSILKSTSCQISWRILKSWSIFKITSHQISNFSIKMWDVTLMGVRGLFEIISCQISNWKDFSLKCGILPQWWSGEKSTHCQISVLKYFGLKNVSLSFFSSLLPNFPSPLPLFSSLSLNF